MLVEGSDLPAGFHLHILHPVSSTVQGSAHGGPWGHGGRGRAAVSAGGLAQLLLSETLRERASPARLRAALRCVLQRDHQAAPPPLQTGSPSACHT